MAAAARVLILTASYGWGHHRVAQVLAAAFKRAGAHPTVDDHFRELVHPAFDSASRALYYWILRNASPLWGVAYWLGDPIPTTSGLPPGAQQARAQEAPGAPRRPRSLSGRGGPRHSRRCPV